MAASSMSRCSSASSVRSSADVTRSSAPRVARSSSSSSAAKCLRIDSVSVIALFLCGEPIAEPEVGVDEAPARQRLVQLVAQLADVDVDRAVVLAERAPPHGGVELGAAHDPAAPVGQRAQKCELAHGEEHG